MKYLAHTIILLFLVACGNPPTEHTVSCNGLIFKQVGTWHSFFRYDVKDDYYYVYGYQEGETCHKKVRSFLDSLVIDTCGTHYITFLKYEEGFPDPGFEGMVGQKYVDALILTHSYHKGQLYPYRMTNYEKGKVKKDIAWNTDSIIIILESH